MDPIASKRKGDCRRATALERAIPQRRLITAKLKDRTDYNELRERTKMKIDGLSLPSHDRWQVREDRPKYCSWYTI